MKKFFVILTVSFFFMACTKNKCEGCEVSIRTYLDDELISHVVNPTDCGATPGTTIKKAPAAFGKTYTIIQTTKCW